MKHEFNIPTHAFFGAGCLGKLGKLDLSGRKTLIVTTHSKRLAESGIYDRLRALLAQAGSESVLFDKVHPNPGKKQVEEGAQMCRQEGCDVVLGFGGGSSIDTAKSIAVLAANGGDFWDYVATGSGLGKEIEKKPLTIIAVPTTAGTGTELNPWVVITKEETNEKLGFGSPSMFASYAFIDPELMLSIPPMLTAFQGFDALFHAMEGYIATVHTPISDIFALKSISLLGQNLITAVSDGSNLEAREAVALASSLAGVVEAISNCTSNHSIAQAMGAYHDDLPHGAALLMISMEYFKRFEAVIPQRYAQMAQALTGRPDAEAADLVKTLFDMEKACGVEALKMSDYGITRNELEIICANAYELQGELFEIEPKPLTRAEALEVLENSYR